MSRTTLLARPLDQMVRDQFAAAIELATTQHQVDPMPPGNIAVEERDRGGKYGIWRRRGIDGKYASPVYVGAVGSEKYENAVAHREELERIERTAKNLRKLGYATEDNASAIVLATLANAGYFTGGGVLIGTRAFRCITNHLGFAVPMIATQDVDIARPHIIELANKFPKGGMLELLKQTGLKFMEVPGMQRNEASSSWKVVGKEIKLDLLVPAKSIQTEYKTIEVPELGAHATALLHLDYLIEDPMDAIVIGKSQLVPVKVPSPARFFWHKLAVAQMRPDGMSPKAGKDLVQAASLGLCMAVDYEDELLEAGQRMKPQMKRLVQKSIEPTLKQVGDKKDILEPIFEII